MRKITKSEKKTDFFIFCWKCPRVAYTFSQKEERKRCFLFVLVRSVRAVCIRSRGEVFYALRKNRAYDVGSVNLNF